MYSTVVRAGAAVAAGLRRNRIAGRGDSEHCRSRTLPEGIGMLASNPLGGSEFLGAFHYVSEGAAMRGSRRTRGGTAIHQSLKGEAAFWGWLYVWCDDVSRWFRVGCTRDSVPHVWNETILEGNARPYGGRMGALAWRVSSVGLMEQRIIEISVRATHRPQ